MTTYLKAIAALIFFGALNFIPNLHLLSTAYIGGNGDGLIYVWLCEVAYPALSSFTTDAFYPYRNNLAFSDNFILPSFIYLKLRAFFSSELSFNLIILTSRALGGFVTYLLISRYLTSHFISVFLATLYANHTYFTTHISHPQLQFFFVLPLGLYLALAKLDIKNGFLIALNLFVALTTSIYYFVFLNVLLVVTKISKNLSFFLQFAAKLRSQDQESFFSSSLLKKIFIDYRTSCYGLLAASSIFLSYPILRPYLWVKETFGRRYLHEPYYFSASLTSYFSGVDWRFSLPNLSHGEAHLWLGLPCMTLFILAILRNRALYVPSLFAILALAFDIPGLVDNDAVYLLLKIAAGTCAFLSIMTSFLCRTSLEFKLLIILSALSIGPLTPSPTLASYFSPYFYFYTFFPGFSGVRAIARIYVLIHLTAIIIIAQSLKPYLEKAGSWRYLPITALGLVVLYVNTLAFNPHVLASGKVSPPPLAIAEIPPRSVTYIRFYPNRTKNETHAMIYGHRYNLRMINGYSGVETKVKRTLKDKLDCDYLTTIKDFQYLVTTKERLCPNLKKVKEFADGSVLMQL